MATQTLPRYTLLEYLDQEQSAEEKHEYFAGHIYAMAGGTAIHSRLCVRAIVLLHQHLAGCNTFDSNLKVYVESADLCTYPDCFVICGESQFLHERRDVITNPTIVVEVLSPSTERYDQDAKSSHYRTIPSLRHILLIGQDRVMVEQYTRVDEQTWTVTRHSDRIDVLTLGCHGETISVDDLYWGIL